MIGFVGVRLSVGFVDACSVMSAVKMPHLQEVLCQGPRLLASCDWTGVFQ